MCQMSPVRWSSGSRGTSMKGESGSSDSKRSRVTEEQCLLKMANCMPFLVTWAPRGRGCPGMVFRFRMALSALLDLNR